MPASTSSTSVMEIIRSEYPLAAIESPNPERVVRAFGKLAADTGMAIYLWEPSQGLNRLEGHHLPIPDTRSIYGLLHHIASTNHFGVYLISGLNRMLDDPHLIAQLRGFAAARNRARRLIIFIDEVMPETKALGSLVLHVQHAVRQVRPAVHGNNPERQWVSEHPPHCNGGSVHSLHSGVVAGRRSFHVAPAMRDIR